MNPFQKIFAGLQNITIQGMDQIRYIKELRGSIAVRSGK